MTKDKQTPIERAQERDRIKRIAKTVATNVTTEIIQVGGVAWGNVSDKPSTFEPATHANHHVTGGTDVIANAIAGGASGLMSGSDKTKLDGIASGAEVNVNADWNSSSGDSQILNKPSTMTPSAHNHAATDINSGTLDGDRLPGLSETKKGGVPATGEPSGLFLKDDGTWAAAGAGGAHAGTHVTGGGDTIADAVASGNSGLMSGADKAKLDGVASGAEVNVNADWTADSGDAQILNKPSTMPPTAHNHAGSEITSGTIDGDRLPAISTTKAGAVPATGVASGKYLKDDGNWSTVSAGAGDSAKKTITQASHGFAAGDVIYRKSDSTYAKAKADVAATAEAIGIVESVDGNDFVAVFAGVITGLSGLTDGSVYFLSAATAGLLTATEPDTTTYISKPILIATSATTGIVVNMRGLSEATADYASIDVMGPRLTYDSTTQLTLANFTSNQSRLHNGTNWVTVRKASEPTLANSANDMGGTALTYGYNYDVFEVYASATSSTIACAIWATDTARYAAWAGTTLYKVGKRVSNSGSYYACVVEHTSGTFADDLAAGKWVLLEGTGDFLGLGVTDGTRVYANSGDWRKYRHIGTIRLYNDTGAKFRWTASHKSIANEYNRVLLRCDYTADAAGGTFTSTTMTLWTNWTSPGISAVFPSNSLVNTVLIYGQVCAVADSNVYCVAIRDGNTGIHLSKIQRNYGANNWDVADYCAVFGQNPGAGYHYYDLYRAQTAATANASTQYLGTLHILYWA